MSIRSHKPNHKYFSLLLELIFFVQKLLNDSNCIRRSIIILNVLLSKCKCLRDWCISIESLAMRIFEDCYLLYKFPMFLSWTAYKNKNNLKLYLVFSLASIDLLTAWIFQNKKGRRNVEEVTTRQGPITTFLKNLILIIFLL